VVLRSLPNLLGRELAAALLAYALENEARFAEATVGGTNSVDRSVRHSRVLTDLGALHDLVEGRIADVVPLLIADLGLTPFIPTGYEIELVAHEDGAFYGRHIDLFSGTAARGGASDDRLISVVCYLNHEPKGFSGGELRLYQQVDPSRFALETPIDVVPEHGMAVAFSSWLPHEVRRVHCPSGKLRDARFTLNCWVLRHRSAPDAAKR
jgi:SM-20-related protein